jgi:hypothetical protein
MEAAMINWRTGFLRITVAVSAILVITGIVWLTSLHFGVCKEYRHERRISESVRAKFQKLTFDDRVKLGISLQDLTFTIIEGQVSGNGMLDLKTLAKKIKSAYPEYSDLDDKALTRKFLTKYPSYLSTVDTMLLLSDDPYLDLIPDDPKSKIRHWDVFDEVHLATIKSTCQERSSEAIRFIIMGGLVPWALFLLIGYILRGFLRKS